MHELWVTQEVGFFGVTDYKPAGWTVGLSVRGGGALRITVVG
jgi:hypothetical protein